MKFIHLVILISWVSLTTSAAELNQSATNQLKKPQAKEASQEMIAKLKKQVEAQKEELAKQAAQIAELQDILEKNFE